MLLLHVGKFLVPELGKLQELTPATMRAISETLATSQKKSTQGQPPQPGPKIEEVD